MDYRLRALSTLTKLKGAKTPRNKILCSSALTIVSIAAKLQNPSLLSLARHLTAGV